MELIKDIQVKQIFGELAGYVASIEFRDVRCSASSVVVWCVPSKFIYFPMSLLLFYYRLTVYAARERRWFSLIQCWLFIKVYFLKSHSPPKTKQRVYEHPSEDVTLITLILITVIFHIHIDKQRARLRCPLCLSSLCPYVAQGNSCKRSAFSCEFRHNMSRKEKKNVKKGTRPLTTPDIRVFKGY